MYPRSKLHVRLLPALFALIFSLLAFVFSMLAINSKEWAVRHNYNPLYPPQNWTEANIIYTLYRAPFIICSATQDDTNSTIPTYSVSCQNYRPFGFDRTSCEEEVATQSDSAANLGDARLCQQIHLAGNFGITSTLFISLGFILTSVATIATFAALRRTEEEPQGTEPRKHHRRIAETQDDEIVVNDEVQESREPVHHEHEGRRHHRRRSVVLPYLHLTLLTFLCIGVVTALISQFYGVEGLMQSAYNNADFSTSQGTSSGEIEQSGIHGPWYQGKGLSRYATCAWGFAAAAAVVAARTWRLPQWQVEM